MLWADDTILIFPSLVATEDPDGPVILMLRQVADGTFDSYTQRFERLWEDAAPKPSRNTSGTTSRPKTTQPHAPVEPAEQHSTSENGTYVPATGGTHQPGAGLFQQPRSRSTEWS